MNRLVLTISLLFLLVSFLEAAAYDRDLSVYIDFDEIDGNVMEDNSGNGNYGMLTQDADLEEGIFGNALRFTAGLRVEFDGLNFAKMPEEAVSMAVWVNTDSQGDMEVFDVISSKFDRGLYHFEIQANGSMRWFHRDDSEATVFDITTGSVPVGEWVHIAGTYDSNAGQAVLYINGSEIMTAAGAGKLSTDWELPPGMGRHRMDRQFLGLMDEFYIFRRALSAAEVKDLMDGGFGPFAAVQPGGKLAATWGRTKL